MNNHIAPVAIRFNPESDLDLSRSSVENISKLLGRPKIGGFRPVALLARQGGMLVGTSPLQPAHAPMQAEANRAAPTSPRIDLANEAFSALQVRHQLSRVIFILDCSQSMGDSLFVERRSESKISHLRSRIRNLPDDYLPAETKVSLITLRDEAHEVRGPGEESLSAFKDLVQSAECDPSGLTAFTPALIKAKEIIERDRKELGHLPRSLVVFLTDGHDNEERVLAPRAVRELRELNAAVVMGGIGESYDFSRVVHLAGVAGYSGWAHSPIERVSDTSASTFDLFSGLIPRMARDIECHDSYLTFQAYGAFDHLTSATYSICRVPTKKSLGTNSAFPVSSARVRGGYAETVRGILLEDPSKELDLRLFATAQAGPTSEIGIEVSVVDASNGGLHLQDVQESKSMVYQWLLGLIAKTGDQSAIQDLRDRLPSDHPVRQFLQAADLKQHFGPDDNHGTFMGRSILGSVSGAKINDWSRVAGHPEPRQLSPLHSGALGPLSKPVFSDIAPANSPNPAAYDKVPDRNSPQLQLISPTGTPIQSFSLDGLFKSGKSFMIGRESSADLCLSTGSVSRKHCELKLAGGTLVISDLGSRNGTFLNGLRVASLEEVVVQNGDTISICDHKLLVQLRGVST